MAINPEPEAIIKLVKDERTTPVVMLNLLRYREQAEYPEEASEAACSGQEAYDRYAKPALEAVARAGGRVIWSGATDQTVVGEAGDEWDHIILVEYPSRQAFLEMYKDPGFQALAPHRIAGLERAVVLANTEQALV